MRMVSTYLLAEAWVAQKVQPVQDKIDGYWQLSNHLHQDQLYIMWLILIISGLLLAMIPVFFFFRLRRNHMKDRLKSKDYLLHAVLDKVPYPIYLKSSTPPYDVVYLNRATRDYWKDFLDGKNSEQIVDKYFLARQNILREVLDTGTPRRVVVPLRLSNKGDNKAIDIIIQRIIHGETPYLLTTIVDVTNQIEAKEHALLVERMKMNFLSSLSEELTAPLDDLLHAVEELDSNELESEEEEEFVETIGMTGHYILQKIDNGVQESLNISSSHGFKETWQSFEILNQKVDGYVQKIINRYDYMIDYSIVFQIQTGEAFLDTFLWMQALDRMITTAVENMKHGMLRLTVGYRGGYVVFFIEDDGPRYTKELQSKLYKYQPVQADPSSISDLSYANMQIGRFYPEFSIIREVGGSMGIYSTEDKGATQWVYIPLETRNITFNDKWQDHRLDNLLRRCNLFRLFKDT